MDNCSTRKADRERSRRRPRGTGEQGLPRWGDAVLPGLRPARGAGGPRLPRRAPDRLVDHQALARSRSGPVLGRLRAATGVVLPLALPDAQVLQGRDGARRDVHPSHGRDRAAAVGPVHRPASAPTPQAAPQDQAGPDLAEVRRRWGHRGHRVSNLHRLHQRSPDAAAGSQLTAVEAAGQALFEKMGCPTCHAIGGAGGTGVRT